MPCKESKDRKERAHRYYITHKERINEKGKAKDAENKLLVFTHYSKGEPKCSQCEINDIDVLCVDHINGGGSKHRAQIGCKAGRPFYKWLIKMDYPTEFQVLCYNCNMKKRIRENK